MTKTAPDPKHADPKPAQHEQHAPRLRMDAAPAHPKAASQAPYLTGDATIDALDYAETLVEQKLAINRVGLLTAHRAALEEAYTRSLHWKETIASPPLKSDEGIEYTRVSTHRIVNLHDRADKVNAHRLELHVNGVVYTHVEETSTGEWIYRHDD